MYSACDRDLTAPRSAERGMLAVNGGRCALAEHRKFPRPKRPCVQQGLRGGEVLLKADSYGGERLIGIRADETDGADHQNQNHCEHHCILRDILPAVVSQHLGEKTHFLAIPFNCENPDSGLKMPTLQKTSAAGSGPLSDSSGRMCSRVRAMSIGSSVLLNS